MAVAYAGVEVELREVVLKHKPAEMLAASPKGTVPVLLLQHGVVLDESIDVMRWALTQSDHERWQSPAASESVDYWIANNDGPFKHWLDRYKYADRHPAQPREWYRDQASGYLASLEAVLATNDWLHGNQRGLADVALFPFLRPFPFVDTDWFSRSPYAKLRAWLHRWLNDPLFINVMEKYPRWDATQKPITLPLRSRAA